MMQYLLWYVADTLIVDFGANLSFDGQAAKDHFSVLLFLDWETMGQKAAVCDEVVFEYLIV